MAMAVEITRRRFTADEYQAMGRAGILRDADRVELIDGEVVAKMTIGPRHNATVNRLNRVFTVRAGDMALVQVQGSVRLDAYSEPEPDVVLLRPRPDFYESALPGAADVMLVVEVAETSIDYDRTVKAGLYARLGIAEYWLVDLNDAVVTRCTDPADGHYRRVAAVPPDEPIAPGLVPACVLTTRDIFG